MKQCCQGRTLDSPCRGWATEGWSCPVVWGRPGLCRTGRESRTWTPQTDGQRDGWRENKKVNKCTAAPIQHTSMSSSCTKTLHDTCSNMILLAGCQVSDNKYSQYPLLTFMTLYRGWFSLSCCSNLCGKRSWILYLFWKCSQVLHWRPSWRTFLLCCSK